MSPRRLLRLEGGLVLVAALAGYAHLGASWGLFAVLLLVPDLLMAGYLLGPRVGAVLYNAGHTYAGPFLLGAAAVAGGGDLLGAVALVWTAHIGMDRALGYGLKRPSGFHDTHLSRSADPVLPRPDGTDAVEPSRPGSADGRRPGTQPSAEGSDERRERGAAPAR